MSQTPLDYQPPPPKPAVSRLAEICVGAGIGAVATIPAVFAALASAGAGHGHYVAARALFPIPILLTYLGNGFGGEVLILAALAQFPIYGAVIGYASGRARVFAVLVIAAAHLAAAAVCFSGAALKFS